jgi:transposase
VKAYVKRNKNDAADAAAICEAVTRPSMRFVPVKDVDQQAVLMMHRARNLLVRQRTMAVNALRAHLAEFGVVAPQCREPSWLEKIELGAKKAIKRENIDPKYSHV